MTKIKIIERDGVTWADIEDPKGEWVSDKEWWSEPTERAYFGYERRLEERLRDYAIECGYEPRTAMREAADEIERLRSLNAELVAALEAFVQAEMSIDHNDLCGALSVICINDLKRARAALAKVESKK